MNPPGEAARRPNASQSRVSVALMIFCTWISSSSDRGFFLDAERGGTCVSGACNVEICASTLSLLVVESGIASIVVEPVAPAQQQDANTAEEVLALKVLAA
jgi:hypothetical protein